MSKTHTHWPDGKGPVCRFATKRECDLFARDYNKHAKEDYDRAVAQREQNERERQHDAADQWIKKEWARMSGLPTKIEGQFVMKIKR